MIQPNDVRVGNFVKQAHATLRVLQVFTDSLQATDDNGHTGVITCQYTQPIPLSSEVLTACGFVWGDSDEDNRWLNLSFGPFTFQTDESAEFKAVWAKSGKTFISTVTTLHQLQNLYFALTGSELEVSLPLIGNSPDNR